MKYEYLNFLKCPITEEDLQMEVHEEKAGEILSGKLLSSKAEFPITNGIPRFVKDQGYSDSFDSVTPSYQSTYTVYEVYRWFKETNFKYIKVAAWENIIGTKK